MRVLVTELTRSGTSALPQDIQRLECNLRTPPDTRTATRLSSFPGSWPSSRVGAPELVVNGEGTAVRDFVPVANMATAFLLALRACEPGSWRASTVGSGYPSTMHEVIATAEAMMRQ